MIGTISDINKRAVNNFRYNVLYHVDAIISNLNNQNVTCHIMTKLSSHFAAFRLFMSKENKFINHKYNEYNAMSPASLLLNWKDDTDKLTVHG
eukprot:UN06716